jgi:cell division protein FtsI (penicillin-binding protein 3)
VATHQAKSASAIVLDAKSGEILTMVNYPSYNPNIGLMRTPTLIRNRAVTDTFEPASTIKAFTIASVLANGQYQADSVIDTSPGWLRIGRDRVSDDGKNYGPITVTEILEHSSNVGIAKLLASQPKEQLRHLLHGVGFGEITGISFPGEQSGTLPSATNLGDFSLATLGFGYGLSVSTLQLARAYQIIANHGIKLPVTLLRQESSVPGTRVIAPEIADQILQILETVVQSGTGKKAQIPGFRVAGKTGTAKKVGQSGYEKHHYTALFVGIAPVSNPRLVVAVVVHDPQGKDYTGGQVAGPIFAKIMADALRVLNIAPDAKQA